MPRIVDAKVDRIAIRNPPSGVEVNTVGNLHKDHGFSVGQTRRIQRPVEIPHGPADITILRRYAAFALPHPPDGHVLDNWPKFAARARQLVLG